MKKTQEQFVIDRLLKNGEISRNECLQNFISRLGAIICSLNQTGEWEINGEWYKTEFGRDYKYFLRRSPFKKQEYKLPNGEIISKTVRA